MTPRGDALVQRNERRLEPDASRVVAQLFVAGQEVVGASESRASGVVARILALDEEDVQRELADLVRRFGDRHRDLVGTFSHHADRVANRLDADAELSPERWLLLGATFTHEYSIEAASLCNPSIVAHPDQSSAPAGAVDFVMSVRGIGEGHRSSIGFRTGTIGADGEVIVDDAGRFPTLATVESAVFDREQFAGRLRAIGEHTENATYVLDHLDDTFSGDELEWQIGVLAGQHDTRPDTHTTAALLRSIAACSYTARFSAEYRDISSGCSRPPWRPRREAWRTRASSDSSTTTALSPTTPPTRPSTASRSASSCCGRPTSSSSSSRR